MIILGLLKTTLLDYPEHIACILFTGGCNLRCPYCQNAELIYETEPLYDTNFIMNFLNKRKSRLEAVVISGGEPCIHKDLPEFLSNIKSLGYLIKLDTNGCYPDMLDFLIKQSLIDYIAMDIKAPIDSLNLPINKDTPLSKNTGISVPNAAAMLKSIELIKKAKIEHEFRTTVTKELLSSDDLINIAKTLPSDSKFFLQNFQMSDTVPDKTLHPYPPNELTDILLKIQAIVPNSEIR